MLLDSSILSRTASWFLSTLETRDRPVPSPPLSDKSARPLSPIPLAAAAVSRRHCTGTVTVPAGQYTADPQTGGACPPAGLQGRVRVMTPESSACEVTVRRSADESQFSEKCPGQTQTRIGSARFPASLLHEFLATANSDTGTNSHSLKNPGLCQWHKTNHPPAHARQDPSRLELTNRGGEPQATAQGQQHQATPS